MSGSQHYEELLTELKGYAEPAYAQFHKRLLKNDNINVLGVRVPTLRKIAKGYKGSVESLLNFPDEYYEVTFIKLQAVALLPWEEFIIYVDKCVSLIDNWATCDCFAPKCIAKNKRNFLPYIEKYLQQGSEFFQRFALTTLLHFYVEEEWLSTICTCIRAADTGNNYVRMAVAWLVAEVIVKYFNEGLKLLSSTMLDIKTQNKAIQKACESLRLTEYQKNLLKTLKKRM